MWKTEGVEGQCCVYRNSRIIVYWVPSSVKNELYAKAFFCLAGEFSNKGAFDDWVRIPLRFLEITDEQKQTEEIKNYLKAYADFLAAGLTNEGK